MAQHPIDGFKQMIVTLIIVIGLIMFLIGKYLF
jgi:hypothetical protein